MDGVYQYSYCLCDYVYDKKLPAKVSFPAWFHQWTYEREHVYLVCNYDCVAYEREGEIEDRGTHEQLMEREGTYQRFVLERERPD